MDSLLLYLETYCKNLVSDNVRRMIKHKYRNVFHLDDPFVNTKMDEYLLVTGNLENLSYRIKEDYNKFTNEEMLKIYNKLTKLIDKLYNEDKS